MATPAPPSIVINDPSTNTATSQPPKPSSSSTSSKPTPPALDTTSTSTATTPTQATYGNDANTTTGTSPLAPLLKRTNSLTTTDPSSASCYLCDEQNPGDFSPTTKHLDSCVLCSRYFCPIHHSPQHPQVAICNINHSTYYHEMLLLAKKVLSSSSQNNGNGDDDDNDLQTPISPITGEKLEGRGLAELLIQEGIYPSLGEREKAIFVTSPIDEQKVRELGAWRSLDAAVANGGVRGEKGVVEEREVVGADIAV